MVEEHWELHSCWLPAPYWAAYGKAQSKNERPFVQQKDNRKWIKLHFLPPFPRRIKEEKFS